jgi:hypothetical protein
VSEAILRSGRQICENKHKQSCKHLHIWDANIAGETATSVRQHRLKLRDSNRGLLQDDVDG